jgi:hypothetical protein
MNPYVNFIFYDVYIGLNIGLNLLLFVTYRITHYIQLIILWDYIVDSVQIPRLPKDDHQ